MRGSVTVGFGEGTEASRFAAHPNDPFGRASNGFSYVEVMVAVVLVGMTVIAALVGLRTTVVSGRVGTERSQMLLWVQEGAEALHRAGHPPCSTRTEYQGSLDDVEAPAGVTGGSLVVEPPHFLSIDPVTFTERWDDSNCDAASTITQLLITATSAEGTSVGLEVVLDG